MNGDDFADTFGATGARFYGRFYCGYISANHSCDEAPSSLFIGYELDPSGFNHRVRGLDHGRIASALNHPQCFCHNSLLNVPYL
jgi:hypothetical protein